MKPIKVSIIIPTYNRSKYLKQSIESALKQDYENLELVITDNASSDNTFDIVKPYIVNKKIKYFRNKKNIGMYPNWQKAVYEYSSGEWFLILSDDDYFIDNSYISKAIKLIDNHKDMVSVHANYLTKNQANEFTEVVRALPKSIDGTWYFKNFFNDGLGTGLLTLLFKKSGSYNFKFFSHENIISCDWADFLRVALHGKIGFINSSVAVYRLHQDNASALADMDKRYLNLKIIDLAYDYAKKNHFFTDDYLISWRKEKLKIRLNALLIQICELGDYSKLKDLAARIKTDYPFAWTIFFYLENAVKIIFLKFPSATRLMRAIKNTLTGSKANFIK